MCVSASVCVCVCVCVCAFAISYVIDTAWQGVLYGLYSHEPEGRSPEGE